MSLFREDLGATEIAQIRKDLNRPELSVSEIRNYAHDIVDALEEAWEEIEELKEQMNAREEEFIGF